MQPLRVALVGPGRSRNGLGPFLASFVEEAGGRVVAACGRDRARTESACADLSERLGHRVEAESSVDSLSGRDDVDALVVACPAEGHEQCLRLGAERSLHVLCEKPLVSPGRESVVPELCDAFAARGLVLMENTQWPEVLGVYDDLPVGQGRLDWRPEAAALAGRREIAMGLSPAGTGFEMCADSLSHLLSVAQATSPIGSDTRIVSAEWSSTDPRSTATRLDAVLAHPGFELALRFELAQVPVQPRPAWIELDGVRVDRSVDPNDGYRMSMTGPDGFARPIDDPMRALVYRFVALCLRADDARAEIERSGIRERARLYAALCSVFQR